MAMMMMAAAAAVMVDERRRKGTHSSATVPFLANHCSLYIFIQIITVLRLYHCLPHLGSRAHQINSQQRTAITLPERRDDNSRTTQTACLPIFASTLPFPALL